MSLSCFLCISFPSPLSPCVCHSSVITKSRLDANWTLLLCRYLVILDDDVFFTSATRLEVLLDTLEADPHVHVAAGSYTQYDSHKGLAEVNDYSLLFEATGELSPNPVDTIRFEETPSSLKKLATLCALCSDRI